MHGGGNIYDAQTLGESVGTLLLAKREAGASCVSLD